MSTLRVSNIEAKADPSSPSVDEKLKVTNSNGDVLIHIDGKTAGITTVGINTTDSSFTVDAAQNIEFIGIVTATKFSLSGGGEITGGDGNFTGIVTAGSLSVTNNVSIGGTLTYEDVTSIDSVGIITAQSDVHVGAGLSVVGISTLANTNVNGQLTASNFNVTGVSTLGNTVIGTGTTELIVTGDARVTGILTATTFSGNLTGNVTGNVTGESTLSGISSSISDTATDVFVYDTSKDSDGGAWRKRTTHTSWYNETLGTATRGTRKEFPAVAVIVAEQNFIKIYDGDDPDLPMWMVFNTIAGGNSQGMADRPMVQVQNIDKVVHMLNGILATGTKNEGSNYGQPVINFISEKVLRMDSQGGEGGEWMGNIAQRNDAIGYKSVDYDYVIAASRVNDVAMTVLPNAPIDSATGLPVPTIAVATEGGVSIIKDDGNVYDIVYTGNTKTVSVAFNTSGNLHFVQHDNDVQFVNVPVPTQDYANGTAATLVSSTGGSAYHTGNDISGNTQSAILGDVVNDTLPNATSGTSGLTFISNETPTGFLQGAVAYATTSYNTGWMHGDIKGAFLSDTDTTNVTGSNLIDNGDFGTGNFTNWSTSGTTTPSISSGGALLTTGAIDGDIWQSTSGEATSGKWVISWTVTSNSGGFFGLFLNNDGSNGSGGSLVYDGWTTSGSYYYEGSITAVEFRHRGSSSGIIDNITLRRVEDDRSVNNKGLQVFGTVTKTAVATGAELVGYNNGASNANYLKQPYNSGLDFGTGNFSVCVWIRMPDYSTTGFIFDRADSSGNERFCVYTENNAIRLYTYNTSGSEISTSLASSYDNQWIHYVVSRHSSGLMEAFINGIKTTTTSPVVRNVTNIDAHMVVSGRYNNASANQHLGDIALLRISGSIPSDEQIKKIYEDEKFLFQENAKATLYGSSDAVTALAFDEVTDQLHVGTSSGRSDFQGLRRINNTTTAVTTAISAHDEFIIEQ